MTSKQEAALRLALDALDEFCELGAIIRPLEVRDALREALAEQPANVAAVNTSAERVDKTAENVHEQPAQQEPVANRDDVIRMAREAGFSEAWLSAGENPPHFEAPAVIVERFADAAYAAGAAAERDEILAYAKSEAFNRMHGERSPYAYELVNYIRSRGQA